MIRCCVGLHCLLGCIVCVPCNIPALAADVDVHLSCGCLHSLAIQWTPPCCKAKMLTDFIKFRVTSGVTSAVMSSPGVMSPACRSGSITRDEHHGSASHAVW